MNNIDILDIIQSNNGGGNINNLKAARKAKGLSQVEVSQIIGLSQPQYSAWENGKSRIDSISLSRLATLFDVSVDYLLGKSESEPTSTGGKWIPVLGEVAAGIPIEAVEDVVDYEEIDSALAATGEFFGLRIKGSSMEPRIREGDVVIVRKQDDADTGDTAVVMVNGDSATVKRIKKEPDGSLVLIPNNPAYDAQHFSPAEIADKPVHIIGKVVELRGKF